MTDRKELELLVRAQIKGGKDLEGVAKSIAKIGDAIDEQTEAAKRGESRIDELKGSLEGLNLIQKQLAGQNSAIQYFEKLTKSITASETKLDAQTKRYTEYLAQLEKGGTRTDAQQKKLEKYALSVEKSASVLDNQRKALASLESEFREAGVSVDQLGDVTRRNLELQAELGLAYQRGEQSIKGYSAAVRAAREEQRKMAEVNQQAEQAMRQFAAAEKRADDARAARQRDADQVLGFQQRDANERGNRNAEVVAARRLDEQQRQAADRARELAALQRDIVDRSATAAFQQQAKAAQDTARSYTTLARAAGDLNPKVKGLREAINDILNPTDAARATIDGLENEVGQLAASVGKIRGPVQGYKEQIERLVTAQRSLGQQASLIDNFNKQVIALRAARAAFTEARAEVGRYAAEVAKGGDEGAQFAAKLAQAQNALRGSAQVLAQQVQATRNSRDALRAAGIETDNLAASQARLNAAARASVTAVTSLDAAVEKYGQSTKRASGSNRLFGDEGRTTLSYVQRLRGEVLSLVAAYGGLFTVINTARGAVQAFSAREGARNQIAISVGNDREAIDAEYEYVRGQADRIGVEFERAIRGYAKFSAAATLAGRSRQEIRSIFETFTEVGRVANLSADDLDGVFKALEQITSKGKVQAEELRGQLGDRLFGAFEIAAKALKDQFPDLDKALKNGLVTSDQLVAIANEYRRVVADQLPAATQSLAAQQARLNNELFDFKLAVADSGFIDSYSNALKELTAFLRSDSGKAFADSVGVAFKTLADLFVLVLDNINLVTTALGLFLTLFTLQRFASGLAALEAMIPLFVTGSSAVASMAAAIGVLKKAFAVLAVAVAAFQLGSFLYDEFEVVKVAATNLVTSLFKAWAFIKSSYQAAIEALPVFTVEVFKKIASTIKKAARGLVGIFAGIAEAVGLDGLGASLRGVERNIDTAFAGFGKSEGIVRGFRENLAKELAQIEKIRGEMISDIGRPAASGRAVASPTTVGNPTPRTGNGEPTEGELKKRQSEIDAITRALETLDGKINRAETDTLANQIAAIDSDYAALARRIGKLGGEAGKVFLAQLTEKTNLLRTQVIKKFNDDLLAEQNALLKKTEDAEEAAGKRDRQNLSARLGAIVSDYAAAYRELEELRLKFVNNNRDTSELDALRARLDSAKAQRLEQEKTKFNTEELNRREALLNDTIAARDKLLSAVNVQKEVGNISDVQAAEQLNAIQGQYVPKINAAAEATRLWAIENAAIFANPEQQAVFLATLDAIRAKATGVKTEFSNLQQAIITGGVSAVNNGLNLMVDSLQGLFDGTKSVGEGFRGLIASFAQFAASFLRDIALMIIRQQLFNALARSGNPILSAVGVAGGGVLHSGGVVGETRNRSRNVSPGWFTNAPRYHAGGIAGLAPSEYPSILEKGEEVLSKDSPRNILNGGGMPAAGGGAQGVRVVIVDEKSKVPEAMNSPDGEQVFMQFARRNVSTLKQILK